MKPGDVVRSRVKPGVLGLFMGLRVFDGDYECAEVMWFNIRAPDGGLVSSIQTNLLEVVR